MKKLSFILALGLLVGVLFAVPAVAQDGDNQEDANVGEQLQGSSNEPKESEAQEGQNESADEKAEGTYNYVAQAGDTYTQMARKAIQTYGLETETNLSGAQIVFAETNLTLKAGSPELDLGEEVEISKADVQEWVEKAQQLSDAQQSNWDYYVQFVDFNTDAVGEAR